MGKTLNKGFARDACGRALGAAPECVASTAYRSRRRRHSGPGRLLALLRPRRRRWRRGPRLVAGHFGLGLGIARALGCRGQANLWALDTFRHVQSSKNSSARGCKKKCQWKTRFVLLDRSRDISREERITEQSMNEGLTNRLQVTAPPPSPRAPAGTRYPKQSPPETAAATSRCR